MFKASLGLVSPTLLVQKEPSSCNCMFELKVVKNKNKNLSKISTIIEKLKDLWSKMSSQKFEGRTVSEQSYKKTRKLATVT